MTLVTVQGGLTVQVQGGPTITPAISQVGVSVTGARGRTGPDEATVAAVAADASTATTSAASATASATAAASAAEQAESIAAYRSFIDDAAALAALSVGDLYRVLSAGSTEIWELHRIAAGPTAVDTGKRFSDNSAWSANFDSGGPDTTILALTDTTGFQKTLLGVNFLTWANFKVVETATGFDIQDLATGGSVLAYNNSTSEASLLGATLLADDSLTMALGLIDANGFLVDVGAETPSDSDATPDPDPVTIDPIYGDELFAFEDSPVSLYVDGLLDGRSATRPDAMVSWSSYPFDGQSSQIVTIDPARCSATSVLSVRRLTSAIDTRREIAVTNRFASADGGGQAGNVAIIGDSITNRRLPELVNTILTGRNYAPTWIGTVECSNNETTSAGGGPLAEGRESRAFADYIYSVIDGEVTDMADNATETANYLAGNKGYRVARIPMLRPSTGSDPADMIRNGYIFDYDRYLTRFGLADPDVVVCLLGWNDLSEAATGSSLTRILEGIDVIYTQVRAALPTAHIVFGLPAPGRTAAMDVQWADETAACLKGYVSAIGTLRASDSLVHFLPVHAHMSQETGWKIGDGTATADSATGIIQADVTDAIHPKGFTRQQLAEQVAAAVAWCLEN